MRQFFSNMKTSVVMRSAMKCSNVCLIVLMGLISSLAVTGLPARDHLASNAVRSLLIGFAPLIGLFVLLVILVLLYSLLLSSVESTFAADDDHTSRATKEKSKWYRVAHCLSNLLTHCLSLKEHSPPAYLAASL